MQKLINANFISITRVLPGCCIPGFKSTFSRTWTTIKAENQGEMWRRIIQTEFPLRNVENTGDIELEAALKEGKSLRQLYFKRFMYCFLPNQSQEISHSLNNLYARLEPSARIYLAAAYGDIATILFELASFHGLSAQYLALDYQKMREEDILNFLRAKSPETKNCIDQLWNRNCSALMIASFNGHERTVRLLLQLGASVTEFNPKTTNEYMIPLIFNKVTDDFYYRYGQSKNRFVTALDWCCQGGDYPEIIEDLLGPNVNGSDIGETRRWSNSHFSQSEPLTKLQYFLGTYDYDDHFNASHLALLQAVWYGRVNTVKMLVEKRGISCDRYYKDKTLLQYACYRGQKEIVIFLIQEFSKQDVLSQRKLIDHRGKDGLVAVIDAFNSENFYEIIEILMNAGASIICTDENMNTPLHLACSKGCVPLVEKLLKKGASLTSKNRDEKTPNQLAEEGNHFEVVQMLESKVSELGVMSKN